jgi:LPS export ABC transporter protein LptC
MIRVRTGAQAYRRTGGPACARTGAPTRRRTGVASRLSPGIWSLTVRLCVCAPVPLVLLAACGGTPKQDAVAQVEAAADTADQLMIGLYQFITENGVRKAYLEADTAFLYENSGRADLKKVKVTFFGPAGDTSSVVTSKLGFYDWRTGKMEARQDVVVLLSNGGRLTTSILRYDQTKNEVSTDQHYVYVAPPDQRMAGEGFVTDPSLSRFRTQRPRGQAGSFTLPGQ